VGLKHFQNKARREWWSIHIEAWQRSGLSQRRYCRMHRLTDTTFTRWLRAITDAEAAKIRAQNAKILAETEHEERRRQRRGRPVKLTANKRSQAVRAFWAMHVETLNWSGMTLTHYAAATKLSRSSLRRWRDLIDSGEVEIDWRAQLHPSARPQISSDVSSAAKERSAETVLTTSPPGDPPRDRRSNRRSFTDEEKLAIVLEAEQPGVSVAAVCRHHDIVTSMVFRWRIQFGFGPDERARLAAVKLIDEQSGPSSTPAVLHDLLRPADGMAAVELGDGRRVFAPIGSDPDVVRRHVAERETTR
jgi:transposase-like protein